MPDRARATFRLKGDALNTRDLLIAGMSYMAPGFSFFFTTALIAANAGAQAPVAYLLAGLGVLAAGATFAEFARHEPSAGALQVFVERGFGRTVGTTAGLVLMCGYLCLQAGVLALFGGWTAHLLSLTFGINVPWPLLSVAGLVVTTALMIRGVGLSIRATWALFLVEFVLTGVLVLIVIARGGASGLTAAPLDVAHPAAGWSGIALAMVFCVFSFVGFEGSVSFAEETPSPRRALPISVIGGIAIMALLYFIGTYAAVAGFGTAHIHQLASDPEPIATLASRFAAPLRPLLEFAVFTSITANLMAAGNANARVLFNMGREGMVARRFGAVLSGYRTPAVAITFFMATTAVLALAAASHWDYLTVFGNVAGLGSLLAILVYMAATVALPFYIRHRRIQLRKWRHWVVPALGAGIWLIPLWGSVKPGQAFPADLYPWITLAIITAAGLYAALRRKTQDQRPAMQTPDAESLDRPVGLAGDDAL